MYICTGTRGAYQIPFSAKGYHMAPNDLQELLFRIAHKHDREAFGKLLQELSPSLLTYAHTFIRNSELAEEIVSDVWLKTWTNRAQLIHIRNLHTYLFVATKNTALNYRAKINNKPLHDELNAISSEQASHDISPLQQLEDQELKAIFEQSLQSLPPKSREAFLLVRSSGMSYKEASREMGISPNTLKTHLSRAIKKLMDQLNKHFLVSIFF